MEITVDIGADVHDALQRISEINKKNIDVTAAEMMSLGARIFLSSLEKKEDKAMKILLENSLKSNEILTELLHILFNRDKSKLGVYDSDTALMLIEKMVEKFMDGLD